MKSDSVKKGMQTAPQRSLFNALGMTKEELDMLPVGAMTMTYECGMRFLTDYLEGDHYFKIHREGHNLDRCRTQLTLVKDMQEKLPQMNEIIKKYK